MAKRPALSIPKHDVADAASVDLCDQLWLALRSRDEHVQRSKAANWCSFFHEGQNRFAFANHQKRRLKVWFLGGEGMRSQFPQLDVHVAPPRSGGWNIFDSWFYVDDLTRVQAAADLLTALTSTASFNVEDRDLTDGEIDDALRANRLRMGIVVTESEKATVRRRRGQARIHTLTVQNYRGCCGVCDITDPALLVASHIVGWAESPAHRGDLSNVICLCRIHDALFEVGYWSLDDSLRLLKRASVTSDTIRQLLEAMTSFASPLEYPPSPAFVTRHRQRVGLAN